MTRRYHRKNKDGTYDVNGNKYAMLVGSRAQVMHGTAYRTSGGLKKHDLKYNSRGRIVSKIMSRHAKDAKQLANAGWIVEKGKFGAVKINDDKTKNNKTKNKTKKNKTKKNKTKNK